jgi:hypothetical protein
MRSDDYPSRTQFRVGSTKQCQVRCALVAQWAFFSTFDALTASCGPRRDWSNIYAAEARGFVTPGTFEADK